jgi:uncharacterized protein YacL
MSVEFASRIVGMVVLAIVGAFFGTVLANRLDVAPYQYAAVCLLVGALTGLVVTPYLTVRPFALLRRRIHQASAQQLVAGIVGLIVGLVIAALISFPLSFLPPPFSQILPFVAALGFGYSGVLVATMRQNDIFGMFRLRQQKQAATHEFASNGHYPLLLDTSVIIDGRIADIGRTGFIAGELVVPNFVLNELQHIADSPDSLRRNRGRRGLDMLRRLQSETGVLVRITDMDIEGVREVDDKLVLLAKQLHCPIITNDYNLNRVAELQGIRVLNVNELANAVKAVFLPGESLLVKIIQEGKEPGQGVGYLDDGTMVVVEDGIHYVGGEVETMVTKVLQTAAGRMLFARPVD